MDDNDNGSNRHNNDNESKEDEDNEQKDESKQDEYETDEEFVELQCGEYSYARLKHNFNRVARGGWIASQKKRSERYRSKAGDVGSWVSFFLFFLFFVRFCFVRFCVFILFACLHFFFQKKNIKTKNTYKYNLNTGIPIIQSNGMFGNSCNGRC